MPARDSSSIREWVSRLRRPPVAAAPASDKPLDLSDLLGRPSVNLATPELQRFIAGKSVLVTGAGGSIGSEICRQVMRFCPGRLVMVERAENALFEIDRELRESWVGADLSPTVADVCDETRIGRIFRAEKPDVVFHCAAHKHVPMMEANPGEAVKNNVFGTKVVADAAVAAGCPAFVMVSTDKAVNPTSVMGATKRCAELYIQSLNEGSGFRVQGSGQGGQWSGVGGQGSRDAAHHSSLVARGSLLNPEPRTLNPSATRFVAVRFGNVLGSSGSVVPIFRKQIAAGGPVTVTHPDMKRYFMTIPEASQLVMQAGAIGRGGEIFVLDMGEPIRILDLATEMIVRSGLTPGEEIEIKFTGVRPGEKLYEELAGPDERTRPTSHAKIRVWELPRATPEQIGQVWPVLERVVDAARQDVIEALKLAVPEYTPDLEYQGPAAGGPTMRLVSDDPDARAA